MKSLSKYEVEKEVNLGTGLLYSNGDGVDSSNGKLILVTRAGYFLFSAGEIGSVDYLHLCGEQQREYDELIGNMS